MIGKRNMLVHLDTGKKAYCLAVRKNGNVVIAYDDVYESAKKQLISDATYNPDRVKGSIVHYISKAQRKDVLPDRVVSLEVYEQAMSSEATQAIREEIIANENKLAELRSEMEAVKYDINQAYRKSMEIVQAQLKNPKPVVVETDDTETDALMSLVSDDVADGMVTLLRTSETDEDDADDTETE